MPTAGGGGGGGGGGVSIFMRRVLKRPLQRGWTFISMGRSIFGRLYIHWVSTLAIGDSTITEMRHYA